MIFNKARIIKILLGILMTSITFLHFDMQEKIFLRIPMPSVICTHFTQLVGYYVEKAYTS